MSIVVSELLLTGIQSFSNINEARNYFIVLRNKEC